MADRVDPFVVSTFAMWAGDSEEVERMLEEFTQGPFDSSAIDDHATSPQDIMRGSAALRLQQLWRRRLELKDRFDAEPSDGLFRRPRVLSSMHMRGVVWRQTEREFLLQ